VFLSAVSVASRRPGGRLSPRSINAILERIGRWHDAEQRDPARWISPLRPHALGHTFAFALAETTAKDACKLERRLRHRSQRYIARYTNPPEEIAASQVEAM
jgi:integrase